MGGFGSRGGIKKRPEHEEKCSSLDQKAAADVINLIELEFDESSKRIISLAKRLSAKNVRD